MAEEKSHVAQVAEELVKLGFSAEEADVLAREKHRAHTDLVVSGGRSPAEIAEEIVARETATTTTEPLVVDEATEAATPDPVPGERHDLSPSDPDTE